MTNYRYNQRQEFPYGEKEEHTMKKWICLLLACLLLVLTACGAGGTEETAADQPDTAAQEAFAASTPQNDTDIGLKNVKIDTAQAELTDEQKVILNYFDSDYLDVPDAEFLQRYPKVYSGTNVHLDADVVRILSEDGDRYEIVLQLTESFTQYFVNKYGLDEADYYSMNFPEEYDAYLAQAPAMYVYLTGDLGDTWFVVNDHIELFGRYIGMDTIQIDGSSFTMPHIEAGSVYFWSEYQYSDSIRYDLDTVTKVAKAVFGSDVNVREPAFMQDIEGYQMGGYYDKPFYIAEIENQTNTKFTAFRFYTKRGMIEDVKTGIDPWLIGADAQMERYLEFSADFAHYFVISIDHRMEKLTLEYYDRDFTKIWKREFDGTDSAHYDYTKNNIYLAAGNSLYILDLATGEDTFPPAFIGEKQEVRKMADGVLCIAASKTDAILKTDLDGNILWTASLPEDVLAVDGIQFVDERIVLQLSLADRTHFVVVDAASGEITQDATSIP